jgi:hypothetical protein
MHFMRPVVCYCILNQKFWEKLTAYFTLIQHAPHRKWHIQQFLHCCVYSLQCTALAWQQWWETEQGDLRSLLFILLSKGSKLKNIWNCLWIHNNKNVHCLAMVSMRLPLLPSNGHLLHLLHVTVRSVSFIHCSSHTLWVLHLAFTLWATPMC